MAEYFTDVELDTSNPEPRCPCVLLLDTSGSMGGAPINELNAGLVAFREALGKDELALLRVEIAVVTFGDHAELVQGFVTANQFFPPTLSASGQTPLGAGMNLALDLIEQRKMAYKANGLRYFRPWVFLVTDGEPTDGELWKGAALRAQAAESNKKVAFFAVGVGGANMATLGQITLRPPIHLNGLNFREMFTWLSSSMSGASRAVADAVVPLQTPLGWGSL